MCCIENIIWNVYKILENIDMKWYIFEIHIYVFKSVFPLKMVLSHITRKKMII